MELVNINKDGIDVILPVHSGLITVFPITEENKERVICGNGVFCFGKPYKNGELFIQPSEEFASVFKENNSLSYTLLCEKAIGWGIGDPFCAFDRDLSLDDNKIVARVIGKYGNFFLRNCSIMEGDSIILQREEFDNFDKFFHLYNKRNKLSLSVEYSEYNIPSLAMSKTKMIEKDGVIDTPDGYVFVLKTLEKKGNIEISAREDNVFIPRFKEI